jgi:hypothetical protein
MKGRKPHILVDTLGLLLSVVVHPANIQDRDGAFHLLRRARRLFPSGLKWSSQHPDEGGCDEDSKAAFGSVWAGAIVVARSTLRGRTR